MADKILIDEFVDIKALETQLAAYESSVDLVIEKIKEVNEAANKANVAKGFSENKKAIDTVYTSTVQLAEANLKLKDSEEAFLKPAKEYLGLSKNIDTTLKSTLGTIDQNNKLIAENETRIKALNKQKKEEQKAYDNGLISLEQYSSNVGNLSTQIQELKIKNSELLTTTKAQIKENQAADGSIDALQQRVGRLRDAYRALNEEDRKGAIGQNLLAATQQLEPDVKNTRILTGDTSTNVGNYVGAAKVLDEYRNKLVQVQQQTLNDSEAQTVLNSQLEKLNLLLGSEEVAMLKATQAQKVMEDTLRNIGIELGINSTQFKALEQSVGASKDEIADINARIKLLSSDTKNIDQLIGAANGIAGAFGAGVGAVELFAGENEDLQKSMQKLQAVMVILTGIQQFTNELKIKGSLLNQAYTYTTGLLTAAKERQAAAEGAARLAALGWVAAIGVAVGALAYLIVKVNSGNSEIEKYNRQQKNLADVNIKASESIAEQVTKLDILKARFNDSNATAQQKNEITKQLNETLKESGISIGSVNDAEKFFNEKSAAYIEAISLRAKVTAALSLATEEYKNQIKLQNTTAEESATTFDKVKAGLSALTSGYGTYSAFVVANGAETKNTLIKNSEETFNNLIKLADENNKQALIKEREAGIRDAESIKATNDKNQKDKESAKKVLEEKKKLEEDRLKALAESKKKEFEIQQQIDKQIRENELNEKQLALDNDKLTYEEKLKAIEDYYNKKKSVEAANTEAAKEEVKANDKTGTISIEQKTAKEIELINSQSSEVLKQIELDKNKAIEDAIVQHLETIKQEVSKGLQDRIDIADAEYNDSLNKLRQQRIDGLLTEKEFTAESEKLQIESNKKKLQNELDFLNEKIKLAKAAGVNTIELEKQVVEIQGQINDSNFENFETNEKKKVEIQKEITSKLVEIQKEITSKLIELGKQLVDTLAAFKQAEFTKESDRLDELKTKNDEQAAADIERINNSTLTEEQKAIAIDKIKQDQAKKDAAVEKQKNKLIYDRAVFEKKMALVQVGINTALAIANTIATVPKADFGITTGILIGIYTAIGAAQAAAIAAAPLPKYAKGRKGGKEEIAIVGEAGTEIIKTVDGKMYLTPDKPTLTYLPSGADVIPNKNLHQYMNTLNSNNTVDFKPLIEVQRNSTYELKSAIKNNRGNVIVINNSQADFILNKML